MRMILCRSISLRDDSPLVWGQAFLIVVIWSSKVKAERVKVEGPGDRGQRTEGGVKGQRSKVKGGRLKLKGQRSKVKGVG
jgi:hypothetical protein